MANSLGERVRGRDSCLALARFTGIILNWTEKRYRMNNINKIRYSENISWVLLIDEVFIFDEITNELYLLKGIMKDFWLLLSKTESFNEITTMLATKYNENAENITAKVLRKIRELRIKNLITTEGII